MPENNSPNKLQVGAGKSTKDTVNGDILSIIGYIGGISSFIWITKLMYGFFPIDMLLFPLLALSIFFMYKGKQINQRVRFEAYYEFIFKEQITTIKQLAEKISNSEENVRTDIIKIINTGYFDNLEFDEKNDKIIFDNTRYKCINCGAPIDINSDICQYCGSSI